MTRPTDKPLPLLTVDDVAESLQSSAKTVRRLIEHGDLPHLRVGRLVRVRPEDFERFIKERLS